MSKLVELAVLMGFTAWASIRIIQETRRHERTSIIHWAMLLAGLIGIDLWRMLEGFAPSIRDSNDLILFLACSLLVVICLPAGLAIFRHIVVVRPGSDESQTSGEPKSSTFAGSPGSRIAKACLVGVTAIVLLALYSASALVGVAYNYGLSALPENKNPSGLTLPKLAVQTATIAEFNHGSRLPVMEPWPVTALIRLLLFKVHSVPARIEGYDLARIGAKTLLLRKPARNVDPRLRRLQNLLVAFWVSRNWTADQAVRTIVAESYYGNGCYGLDEASRGFFGCLPNQLDVEEIALLIGLLHSPGADNPWRYPERAKKRMGYVLGRLASFPTNGAAPRGIKLPSRLAATQRSWCGEKASAVAVEPEDQSVKDLLACSSNGDLFKTKQLLERGVDVNARGGHCKTALTQASRNGHHEVMGLLLDKGADVEARNDFDWTALMWGSRWGRITAVKLLLNKGADVNAKDRWGETALMMASSNGHIKLAHLLKAYGATE